MKKKFANPIPRSRTRRFAQWAKRGLGVFALPFLIGQVAQGAESAAPARVVIGEGDLVRSTSNPIPPSRGVYDIGVIGTGEREMADAHLRFQRALHDEDVRAGAACRTRGADPKPFALPARRVVYVKDVDAIHIRRTGARVEDTLGNAGHMVAACALNVGHYVVSFFDSVGYEAGCDVDTVGTHVQDQDIRLLRRHFAVWRNPQDAAESVLFVRMDDESLRAAAHASAGAKRCPEPAAENLPSVNTAVAPPVIPAPAQADSLAGTKADAKPEGKASALSAPSATSARMIAPVIPRPAVRVIPITAPAAGETRATVAAPAPAAADPASRKALFRRRGTELAGLALGGCIVRQSAVNPALDAQAQASIQARIESERSELAALGAEDRAALADSMGDGWAEGLGDRAISAANAQDPNAAVNRPYRETCARELYDAFPLKAAAAPAAAAEAPVRVKPAAAKSEVEDDSPWTAVAKFFSGDDEPPTADAIR